MSRIANKPVPVPAAVQVSMNGQQMTVKGPKGTLEQQVHRLVEVSQENGELSFKARDGSKTANALTGTMRSVVNNIIEGVVNGFEKKMQLVGVGYRAQAQGKQLNLSLGLSHPVNYKIPEGIEIETPAATEIVVRGCDKQRVGQVCAEIRAFRPPEPYKGKGVKYVDEVIVRKEAKKK